jgi:hypothetical protein
MGGYGMSDALAYLSGPARSRTLVAGALVIFGLGRLGVFSYATVTALPALLYGAAFLVLAAALLGTGWHWRGRLLGRVVAGLTTCALVGFGADVLAGHGSATSALMLGWLALMLLFETVGEHDC